MLRSKDRLTPLEKGKGQRLLMQRAAAKAGFPLILSFSACVSSTNVPSYWPTELQIQLQSCKTVFQLQSLLARFIVRGLASRSFVVCKLVEVLALSRNSSFLHYARLLVQLHVDISPSSCAFLYNLLIRGFSLSSSPINALLSFIQMLRNTLKPDNFTFPFVVKASAIRKSVYEGRQIHNLIVKHGYEADVFVINTLLSFYSSLGHMGSATTLFHTSSSLDVVSYNTLIDGFVKMGNLTSARHLFDNMPERNDVSWSAMISGYAKNGDLDIAQELFDAMPEKKSTMSWNSMITGFARIGLLPLAREWFNEMPDRSIVSWNAMVSGYAQCGKLDSARELFDQMKERDVFSWSCMISGYAQANRCVEALMLFKEMQIENQVKPNEVTILGVLSACAQLAALEQGKWVHAFVRKNGMRLSDNLGAALIDMYLKCGCVDPAVELFQKLDQKNVSTWNALITGLAINGFSCKSLQHFEEMLEMEVEPDDVTFVGVLMACNHGGLVGEGRNHFRRMSQIYRIKPERKHYGCMIDMLGRAGLLEEAEEVVRNMPFNPDVMILGSLLGACRIHSNIEIAHRVGGDFLQLQSTEAGCHILISNICCAAGRWSGASEIRDIIKRKRIMKEPGTSSIELQGRIHEFVAGDRSHPQTAEICSWLDIMGGKMKPESHISLTSDALMDLGEADKEICLAHHSEKLAVGFALINTSGESIVRIVKNQRICEDCHSFVKYVSTLYPNEILLRERTRFHRFKDGSCSCGDYW